MKKHLFFFLLLLSGATAQTQEAKPASRPAFHALANIGLLEGSHSSSFQLQLVNGLSWKGWFAGVGTGIDYYFMRSIPLTVYLERNLSATVPIFLYSAGGVHFIWQRDLGDDFTWNGDHEFNTGLYYDAGFGYRFPVGNRSAIRLSLGYSEKKYKETRTFPNWMSWPSTAMQTEVYRYQLQRLSVKAGFQF